MTQQITHSNPNKLQNGRANTILVFDAGDNAKAVTSSVVVRIADQSENERIRFTGPASFEAKTLEHIVNIILPIVDRICTILRLSQRNFEISLVNLGAASIMDVGMSVSGYSADVPIALAMLSACLEMVVPKDMVFTGHIASVDGDIRMVRSLPAKLEAAIQDEEIGIFVHPGLDKDSSLKTLSPSEKELVSGSISEAKRLIRTEAVHDVGERSQWSFRMSRCS
jgi:predicted ATP-dependent protease